MNLIVIEGKISLKVTRPCGSITPDQLSPNVAASALSLNVSAVSIFSPNISEFSNQLSSPRGFKIVNCRMVLNEIEIHVKFCFRASKC